MRSGTEDWAVLVGAGLSAGAGLPDWKKLTRGALAAQGKNLPEQARALITALSDCEQADPAKFWAYVQSEVCVARPFTRPQELVCQLPVRLFVTLNYDRLLEIPWTLATGRDQTFVMAYPELKASRMGDERLVYLHGRCPGDCEPSFTAATAVLTHAGYQSAYGRGASLPTVVETLFQDYNVLVVGSSLDDPDLSWVLQTHKRAVDAGTLHRRPHVAITSTPNTQYEGGLEYQFGPLDQGVTPLFYHSTDGDHSNLERTLESLVRLVEGS